MREAGLSENMVFSVLNQFNFRTCEPTKGTDSSANGN